MQQAVCLIRRRQLFEKKVIECPPSPGGSLVAGVNEVHDPPAGPTQEQRDPKPRAAEQNRENSPRRKPTENHPKARRHQQVD